jgi:RNA polymerase sigma factor (sigma-70 family)
LFNRLAPHLELHMGSTVQAPKTRPREPWESVTLGELRDEDRFNAFVRSSYARMLALARQVAVSPEDADDATQKAFLELHEVVTGRLAQPKALAVGFMVERVRWRARDGIRDRRRQPALRLDGPEEVEPPHPFDGPAAARAGPRRELGDILIAIHKSEDVRRAGRELAGRRREVFDLLAKEERPADIARRLAISKARVTQLVQLVCAELRARLRERGWECNETLDVPLNFGPGSDAES